MVKIYYDPPAEDQTALLSFKTITNTFLMFLCYFPGINESWTLSSTSIQAQAAVCIDSLAYETHTAVFHHLCLSEITQDDVTPASLHFTT